MPARRPPRTKRGTLRRSRPIPETRRGGAGIDEVDSSCTLQAGIFVLEFELRKARHQSALMRVVTAFDGDHQRVSERRQHFTQPAWPRHRVGVQEHQYVALGGTCTDVACRGWAAASTGQDAYVTALRNRTGSIARTVVDDDQLSSRPRH